MVFIAKDYGRLIRWDRSGAVFTQPIFYNNDSHLFDFFIRYDNADPEGRGHDITVSPPFSKHDKKRAQEIERAQEIVPELQGAEEYLDVTVSNRQFIIIPPQPRPDIPVGRWTRASFAYDVHNDRRVLLKDSWRVLIDDVKPEGDIYRLLHDNQVPNIPLCPFDGDVGDKTYHRTQTDQIIDDPKVELPNRRRWKLTPHRHYRIVLSTIGRKLEDFNRTREFVQAMSAALESKMTLFLAVCLSNLTRIIAHEAAHRLGVLHRDISPSNILIFGEGEQSHPDNPDNAYESTINGGMLIDWDLSKVNCEDDNHSTTRRHSRTVS